MPKLRNLVLGQRWVFERYSTIQNGQRLWVDISPKKIYKWLMSTLKKCSTSLANREMKIKTTMRYHFTPTRMAIIFLMENNKYWWVYGEIGTLTHCWWECKMVQPLWKTDWKFLKKLKVELPFELAIPLLGIYPRELKTCPQKNLYTNVTAALFTITKEWKQPKCPLTDE